jgi:hypothetical protein
LILGPRRVALIAAIAAVALAIIFYPLIVFDPIDTEKVIIDLTRVVVDEDASSEQALLLRTTFLVTNTNTMTLPTSKIDYQLYADGQLVGEKTLSYEDVPVNGRPALFPNSQVPLTDSFGLEYSNDNAEIFNMVQNNSTQMDWSVSGTAIIESGTTQVIKEFQAELIK